MSPCPHGEHLAHQRLPHRYGLGVEAEWNAGEPAPQQLCGKQWVGHVGLDYGSGSDMNGYFPQLRLGVSMAMNSAVRYGNGLAGMNCKYSWDKQRSAFGYAQLEMMNAVFEFGGLEPTCPPQSYSPPPAAQCVDAPSMGTMPSWGGRKNLTCSALLEMLEKSSHQSAGTYCDEWLARVTLAELEQQMHGYEAPPGVDVNTTLAVDMCRATCMAAGAGPCWQLGPQVPWCNASDAQHTPQPLGLSAGFRRRL